MRNAIAALLIAGCTLAPRYERPKLPVSNQFPAAAGSLAAVDLGWRAMFGDPRLQTLIGLALANNRDLRIAALNIEVARGLYRVQRSELLPTVDATASADFSTTPGGVTTGLDQGSSVGSTSRYRVGIFAAYELDLFGRVRSLTKAALEEYLRTVEAFRAAHLSLVGEVVTAYLRERGYAEEYEIAVETEKATRVTYDLTKRLLEGGQRSELDMRAAEAQWQAARAEVPRLARLRAQTENALAVLVGQPLPANLPAAQPLAAQQMIANLSPGVPSQVLLRRPDVLAAEHALRAANANIGAARAAFFPTISLTGFGGFVSSALSNLFSGGNGLWTFAPEITTPLFHGGRNLANLDIAHARKRIEVAQYERTIQVAFREVADALIARALFEHQLAAQVARVEAEQIRFNLSDQRYRAGVEGYLSVLDAQRDLYVAQQELVEVRVSLLTNLADLYRALGGGWRER